MKKCKNCGNEMGDHSLYCIKCGAFAGEETQEKNGAFVGGEMQEKGGDGLPTYHKIILAVAAASVVVCILLYVAGIFGGKGTNGGTSRNGAPIAENEGEETAENEGGETKEKQSGTKKENINIAEKAWTAYQAYNRVIDSAIGGFSDYISALQEYETSQEEDDGDYDGDYDEDSEDDSEESDPPVWEDYDNYDFPIETLCWYDSEGYDCDTYESVKFSGKLLYLDSDDYPEMVLKSRKEDSDEFRWILLTYRDGEVSWFAYEDDYNGKDDLHEDADNLLAEADAYDISCKERQSLLCISASQGDNVKEVVYKYDAKRGSIKRIWCGYREFGQWEDDDSDEIEEFHYKKKYRIYNVDDIDDMDGFPFLSDYEDDASVQRKEVSEEEYQRILIRQTGNQVEWIVFLPRDIGEGYMLVAWLEFASRYKDSVPGLLDLPSKKKDGE